MEQVRATLERVWRAEAGSMIGVLTRRLGDLDRAEEALQDAVAEALQTWPRVGAPREPAGWLVTTAWRRALDALRREGVGRGKLERLAAPPGPVPTDDDRLALIFGCCHPDLPVPAQVALTLRAVSGLTTGEIAAAFLTSEAAMARRLTRARLTVRQRAIPFEVPGPERYGERLASVLSVVYLVFNEGYLATGGQAAQRRELAAEGLSLARRLATLMPTEPEAAGLAALLELIEARAATRLDRAGRLVLLEEQDRTRWDADLIAAGMRRLGAAVARGRPGRYQLEAGIAAQHAVAPSYARTDWAAVRGLYDRLYALSPSPVVLLSRAVATRYTHGPAAALAEVDALPDDLAGYRLLHATRAELLEALGRTGPARHAAARALALATNPAERELLARRLHRLEAAAGTG